MRHLNQGERKVKNGFTKSVHRFKRAQNKPRTCPADFLPHPLNTITFNTSPSTAVLFNKTLLGFLLPGVVFALGAAKSGRDGQLAEVLPVEVDHQGVEQQLAEQTSTAVRSIRTHQQNQTTHTKGGKSCVR